MHKHKVKKHKKLPVRIPTPKPTEFHRDKSKYNRRKSMPKMFIPKLGTKLILTDPWSFSLFCEERNKSLWNLKSGRTPMEVIPMIHRKGQMAVIFLTAGDILTVDRIHIRKGSTPYDSVTLRGEVQHEGVKRKVRFWVVLDNFNTMYAERLPDGA